jgi:ADP-ribose pyrophosphatase
MAKKKAIERAASAAKKRSGGVAPAAAGDKTGAATALAGADTKAGGTPASVAPGAKGSEPTASVVKSAMIYEGPVFGLRRDEVIEPSGIRTVREVITHPGSVVVLPILPDKRILLIRQYRHATRQYMWELVAGRIDAGEQPKEAALREMIEETGYRVKKLRVFLDVFPTPGFLEERMYILLAEGLTAGEATPEEDERIEAKAFTRKEVEKMIKGNVIRDAKTIAGVLYYLRFLA